MLTKLGNIFDKGITWMAYLAAASIAFIFLAVSAQVVARRLLHASISWVPETTEYILAIAGLLAAAWVLKMGGHVSLDFVGNMLSPRKRAILNAITSIIGAIVTSILAWYGAEKSLEFFNRGTISAAKAMVIPLWPFLAVFALCFFMLSIQFLRQSHGHLRRWRKPSEAEHPEDITAGMEKV